MPLRSIWGVSRACLNLFESCSSQCPEGAIAELKSAECRFRAWTNLLRVFSENESLDTHLRAAHSEAHAERLETIWGVHIKILGLLKDELIFAFERISSLRERVYVTEVLKDHSLFFIRELLRCLDKLVSTTILATIGSAIPKITLFAAGHDDFKELSRMFLNVILSRYSLPVRKLILGESSTEVSEHFVPTKEVLLAAFPEGLFLALVKSSIVRYFKILYERDQRDTGNRGETPVMQMLTQNVCDPAKEDMTDFPTTSEAGVALCHRAPKIPDGQKTGTCPICKQILPAEEFKNSNWISHVMKDLQPYVCLSSDCLWDPQFFERRQDWIHHMHKYHTTSWICYLQNTNVWKCLRCKLTSPTEFVCSDELQESFVEHLQKFHPDIEHPWWTLNNHYEEVRQPRSSKSCPMCGTIPHGEDKSQTRTSDNSGVENCIAEHLLQLAFKTMDLLMDKDRPEPQMANGNL